jgi:hypothetical protein
MFEGGMSSGSEAALIARVAGLPASWVEGFGGARSTRALRALALAEEELAEGRAGLVARLHEATGASPPRLRRFLLTVKRDCFNGRSLRRHVTAEEWQELVRQTDSLADRLLTLEEHAQACWEELDRVYEEELQRERRHLRALLGNGGLRRGLALSSASLATSLPRLEATPVADYDRKERRAALSLLRYGSRAAVKLSPFSTLTRLALASVVPSVERCPALRLRGRPREWQERSLVRLRRYLVQQLSEILLRCPTLRDSLPVQLNPSLAETGPGRYLLLRPAGWELPEDGRAARHRPATLRQAPVSRALIDWLRERLSRDLDLRSLRTLLAGILGTEDGPTRGSALVDKLLEIGVLLPVPPWSAQDLRLEERLPECLRRFPEDAGLAAVAEPLAGIVALEDGFPEAVDPAGTAREIERQLDTAWHAALAAAGLPAGARQHRRKPDEVYEDVLLLGGGTGPLPESLVEVCGTRLREALRCVEPWFRLVDLRAPRYELLHTLAALARRRWPSRQAIGALDLFQEARPFWRQIRDLIASPASLDPLDRPAFNPLGLPEIEELDGLRREVWRELPRLLREDGEGSRISATELQALLEPLPPQYAPAVGPCAFLQPADSTGDTWVLNRIFEGTGRYASRFTPVMPADLRLRFTEQMASLSTLGEGEEEIELLDLLSSDGDTLNVHAIQTRRVLSLPGEPLSLAAGREVSPGELQVRLDGPSPLPFLTDGAGRRLMPVHLGGAALAHTPPLITFLALFGPGELRPIPVPRNTRLRGEVKALDRVTLGCVVLARRRWVVPAPLLSGIAGLPPSRAFAALDRWRRAGGIPERVFAIEKVRFGAEVETYKPQYLDFTSPSFCELLLGALPRTSDPSLTLEEMLPAPEAFPRDGDGERWAVELQADSLGLPGETR